VTIPRAGREIAPQLFMKTELKARLELAIVGVLEQAAEEEGFWDGWISEDLAVNMTNAAESVFDANFNKTRGKNYGLGQLWDMSAVQKFIKENT